MRRAGRWAATMGVLAGVALPLTGSAQAATYPAWAGPPKTVKVAHLDFDHFFNPVITVHVGDTVHWTVTGFHSVTFPAKGQQPPSLIVPGSGLVSGFKDAAGNPFWFDGKVPNLIINPAALLPAGGNVETGATYVNSGLSSPAGPFKPFSVRFPKAGTFKYLCLVHPGMTGVVKVVAKSKPVPSPKLDAASAKLAEAALIARARRLAARAKPGPRRVYAGSDQAGVAWLRFFPSTVRVKVGQSVQFVMRAPNEIHTITFGPAAYDSALEKSFTTPVPNAMGPPTVSINPVAANASDPGPLPAFTGTNHGNGFENAGILNGIASPTLPSKATFTFTKAGTYHYECVVHPNMDGTVIVTP